MRKSELHKTTITMAPDVLGEIDRRGYMGGRNRSAVIGRDLARLYELYRLALKTEINLTPSEGALILDSLNGTILDARMSAMLWAQIEDNVFLDGLAGKWEVDGPALIEKLRSLTRLQALALVDMAERFWAGVSSDELASVDPREWMEKELGL